MEKFDQKKYLQKYNKEHYSRFLVDLKTEELEELNKLLKEKQITKADFLRNAIKDLKKGIKKGTR